MSNHQQDDGRRDRKAEAIAERARALAITLGVSAGEWDDAVQEEDFDNAGMPLVAYPAGAYERVLDIIKEHDDTSEDRASEHGFAVCPDCGDAGVKMTGDGYVPCRRFLTCWTDDAGEQHDAEKAAARYADLEPLDEQGNLPVGSRVGKTKAAALQEAAERFEAADVRAAAAVGIDAFWAAVAEALPLVKTGDVVPGSQDEFEAHAHLVVKEWHRLNTCETCRGEVATDGYGALRCPDCEVGEPVADALGEAVDTWVGRRVESLGTPGALGTVTRRSGDELVVDWDGGPSPTRVGTRSVLLHEPGPVDTATLLVLAQAAEYMACESEPRDRGGRDSSYLYNAAKRARLAVHVARTEGR